MSWHVYRIFRVVALCALFCLHSVLIGLISVVMLGFEAGALQFSMSIIALLTILAFSITKFIRRDEAPSRLPGVIAFSVLSILSLAGAVGQTVRGASGGGGGLCQGLTDKRPESCTEAAISLTFAWIAVLFALGGLVVAWLDRSSRIGAYNPYGWEPPMKELPKHYQQSSYQSSHSHVSGPTLAYIPRPRDPYDTPRRKRSMRSQPHQANLRRAASGKAPAPPLPPLPSFHPLGFDSESEAAYGLGRGEGSRRYRRDQGEGSKDLPDLPPPTRRPPKDPYRRETRVTRRISPTDLFAQLG